MPSLLDDQRGRREVRRRLDGLLRGGARHQHLPRHSHFTGKFDERDIIHYHGSIFFLKMATPGLILFYFRSFHMTNIAQIL